MSQIYEQELMHHYRHSAYKGMLESASFASDAHNPSCGDSVSFQVIVKDNAIEKILFQGSGCVISQAAASLLAEHVVKSTLVDIAKLTTLDMLALVKISLGPNRSRCALLALEALQQNVQLYNS